MASKARKLRELLFSLTTRVREIRALSIVDRDGLPLESTLGPGALDEALAAFGGAIAVQLERAQRDFEMGPLYLAHILARDRQLFLVPVDDERTLAAMVDAHATPATISMHLLALARAVPPLLRPALDPPPPAGTES